MSDDVRDIDDVVAWFDDHCCILACQKSVSDVRWAHIVYCVRVRGR